MYVYINIPQSHEQRFSMSRSIQKRALYILAWINGPLEKRKRIETLLERFHLKRVACEADESCENAQIPILHINSIACSVTAMDNDNMTAPASKLAGWLIAFHMVPITFDEILNTTYALIIENSHFNSSKQKMANKHCHTVKATKPRARWKAPPQCRINSCQAHLTLRHNTTRPHCIFFCEELLRFNRIKLSSRCKKNNSNYYYQNNINSKQT